MKLAYKSRTVALALLFVFVLQATVMAAAGSFLTNVKYSAHAADRYHQHPYERIMLELDRAARYRVATIDEDKRHVVLDFTGVIPDVTADVKGDFIEAVRYEKKGGHLLVHIFLAEDTDYQIDELTQPMRVIIDIMPRSDKRKNYEDEVPDDTPQPEAPAPASPISTHEIVPGLTQVVYRGGGVRMCMVKADSHRFTLRPALARGVIPGRQTLSGIVSDLGSPAGVNASYFALSGEILGVTKIDGLIAGTTYYTRSAFGLLADETPVFGKVAYSGLVTLGDVSLPVAGVNVERGKDNLVVYNKFYGRSTRTNKYGTEYLIQNGVITAISSEGNMRIPADGVVVSAHGKAQAAFVGAQIGDPASVYEVLGEPWDDAPYVVGAGPRLLTNGQVTVTVAEEQFPSDIRYGRAPRSAVGVADDGSFVLAVVDGRQAISRGCTLTEWAQLLKDFGVRDAINLDGGGSSELIADWKIINSPSDGDERPIGSAIVVVEREDYQEDSQEDY